MFIYNTRQKEKEKEKERKEERKKEKKKDTQHLPGMLLYIRMGVVRGIPRAVAMARCSNYINIYYN
jgi:hypothetical protein